MKFLAIIVITMAVAKAMADCRGNGGKCIDYSADCPANFDKKAWGDFECDEIFGVCCIPKPAMNKPAPNLEREEKPKRCGRSRASQLRIVGGITAARNHWPWTVSVHQGSWTGSGHICGATLINNQWIVSAAHCFDTTSTSHYLFVLGGHKHDADEGTELKMKAKRIIKHPSYSSSTMKNDIALIQLSNPVTFSTKIQPACVPKTSESFDNMYGTAVGWGSTTEGGSVPKYLQQVALPIVTNSVCLAAMKRNIFPESICAGYKAGGKDACQGDSGGPLLCKKKGENWKLVGVTSWGGGCARPNVYGVYTRVSSYRLWIRGYTSAFD